MLLVDDREGSAELIPILPYGLVEVFHGEKSTADVIIPGMGPAGEVLVGVEVKKLADLLQSETSGRLADTQLPQLFDMHGNYVWLLSIGSYRCGYSGALEVYNHKHKKWFPYRVGPRAVPFAYLEAFLVEVSVMGVHIKQVPDLGTAAQWLVALHNWWQKPWDKHRAMRKVDNSHERALMPGLDLTTNQRQMLDIATKLPVLGYERAWAACHCFENSLDMINAGVERWMEVPGVGKVIAKAIVEALSGRC